MSPRKTVKASNIACPKHGVGHVVVVPERGVVVCVAFCCTWTAPIDHKAVLTPRAKPLVTR